MGYLLEIFQGADLEGQGLLHKQDMIDLLRRGDFGLTKIQVLAVLSEAQLDEHGFISYDPLAPLAAQMHQEQQDDFLFGRARDEVLNEIMSVFSQYDGDQNGTLDPAEFKACLNETGVLGRALDAKEVQSIMLSIDENDDGKVDYEEFINFAIEILDYYWRESR